MVMAEAEKGKGPVLSEQEFQDQLQAEREQIEEERQYKIQQPRMRLPREIKRGEVIRVQVKIRHPSRTGLRLLPDGRFVRGRPAFYIKLVEVFYGETLVSKFELNSSTSDDPLLGFHVKADKEAPVKVVFTNHRDERVEVVQTVKFS
jgi:sulfur-oxidizing protein SoxZ